MTTRRRAAIYLRISQDREGEEFGIGTQRRRTRQLAEARGWDVLAEYTDNSVSASKKRGPGTAWHEMLRAAERGEFDLIVAVDLDRLLRQTSDLNDLIATGAKVVTVDGEIDLSTADGEFRATMLAGIARFEVRRKSERQRRANQQRREQGMPFHHPARLLGFSSDGMEVIEDEAEDVRAMFEQFLDGRGYGAIARSLRDKGRVSGQGRPFNSDTVRYALRNPRYVGMIAHQETGELYEGAFPAIVSQETWDAVQLKLSDPARKVTPGPQPRWMLSGLMTCGKCRETRCVVKKNDSGRRRYVCRGCLGSSVYQEEADEYVNGVMVRILSSPEAMRARLVEDGPEDMEGLSRERGVLVSRRSSLARLLAEGILDAEDVRVQSLELKAKIDAIDAKLAPKDRDDLLDQLASASDVEDEWGRVELHDKKRLISSMLDITFWPVGKGRRAFDIDKFIVVPKQ
jgi:site-specific DNA recombinase